MNDTKDMNHNTSKRKGQHSQSGFVQTVKDWLTPQAIIDTKKRQEQQRKNIEKETGMKGGTIKKDKEK